VGISHNLRKDDAMNRMKICGECGCELDEIDDAVYRDKINKDKSLCEDCHEELYPAPIMFEDIAGRIINDMEVDEGSIEVYMEDQGIGPYEYWGATGVDRRIVEVVEGSGTASFCLPSGWVKEDEHGVYLVGKECDEVEKYDVVEFIYDWDIAGGIRECLPSCEHDDFNMNLSASCARLDDNWTKVLIDIDPDF
jgi:hypothetical protein